ncbi:hypothetical protein I7I53_11952 [Histoplasma capsulatum var. duboisii H88]|uniref:Uncharacterized protein n=1 Tax=Ajellomyces capsulatus (strain H88) TaxID=544711 RepID=A0A8A1M0H9_AJEC8|nr:hypothetical protein I7I53_11952 [Histoplasma capsulatum var. duboisii H88]
MILASTRSLVRTVSSRAKILDLESRVRPSSSLIRPFNWSIIEERWLTLIRFPVVPFLLAGFTSLALLAFFGVGFLVTSVAVRLAFRTMMKSKSFSLMNVQTMKVGRNANATKDTKSAKWNISNDYIFEAPHQFRCFLTQQITKNNNINEI